MSSYTTNRGPLLPAEIMDVVIDQLHLDLKMLGVCGTVCSEWLIRSRYHIFSTVQLWPWRVRRFFELSRSRQCTFTSYVNCIEVNDAQAKLSGQQNDDDILFHQVMSSSSLSRFSHIQSLRIQNVDWTLFSPANRDHLRERLATFTKLESLKFDDVMFHDLREVARITALFPSLRYLVANIQFSKYMEYTITSATTLALPTCLEALRLGTDDAIPSFLSTTFKGSKLSSLVLDGVKFWHLQYVGGVLRSLGDSLRHLQINFSRNDGQWVNSSDLAHLNLKHQKKLQSLHLGGITLVSQSPCALETHIPSLLRGIPSTSNMKNLELDLIVDSEHALRFFGWSKLEHALVKIPRCRLSVNVVPSSVLAEVGGEEIRHFCEAADRFLEGELKSLRKNDRLSVWIHGASTARL
ncbi:hypothetical protein P691DRAFT_774206 [Macrolepiota fuliginosa MF-IS2]|uniref:F-box domain-containing protein n=1 Tax=Macrolepiota fuliginosa MF-IS2 TaxID=1400762 RepID=A0A9P6C2Y2_9AGAR|nr:hypothetical protein P691DRAFT_774206 [Macrolepiota fuliginosa MF-IS2]